MPPPRALGTFPPVNLRFTRLTEAWTQRTRPAPSASRTGLGTCDVRFPTRVSGVLTEKFPTQTPRTTIVSPAWAASITACRSARTGPSWVTSRARHECRAAPAVGASVTKLPAAKAIVAKIRGVRRRPQASRVTRSMFLPVRIDRSVAEEIFRDRTPLDPCGCKRVYTRVARMRKLLPIEGEAKALVRETGRGD